VAVDKHSTEYLYVEQDCLDIPIYFMFVIWILTIKDHIVAYDQLITMDFFWLVIWFDRD